MDSRMPCFLRASQLKRWKSASQPPKARAKKHWGLSVVAGPKNPEMRPKPLQHTAKNELQRLISIFCHSIVLNFDFLVLDAHPPRLLCELTNDRMKGNTNKPFQKLRSIRRNMKSLQPEVVNWTTEIGIEFIRACWSPEDFEYHEAVRSDVWFPLCMLEIVSRGVIFRTL